MTNNKLADALRDMLSGWTYIRQRYGDLDGVGWDRAEDAAAAALAEHDAPDKCFCDRMYPDSNPNASCGDCPTRDYDAQPEQGKWVMVPREPTDAMTLAGKHFVKGSEGLFERGIAIGVWERMLAAAPKPAPAADGAGELPLTTGEAERVGELPALPKMLAEYNPQSEFDSVQLYTSDQVHAYARTAIAALRQRVTTQQPAAAVPDDDIDDDSSCAQGGAEWQKGFNAAMKIGDQRVAQALAQQPGAQAVAWIGTMPNGLRYAHLVEPTAEEGYKEIVPLYAHPQTPIKPRHALGLNELLGGEYDQ